MTSQTSLGDVSLGVTGSTVPSAGTHGGHSPASVVSVAGAVAQTG